MIKIIKGRKYDTETAEQIGVYRLSGFLKDYGLNAPEDEDCEFSEDIDYEYSETLYRKHTGEFFIVKDFFGDGTDGNFYRAAKIRRRPIIILNIDDAKSWIEKHVSTDKYISLFGDVEE